MLQMPRRISPLGRSFKPVAVSPFVPSDIAGLKVWLESDVGVYSDAGITLAVNNATVQQWNDQSGNGNHYTQSISGSRPTFKTSVTNGKPGLLFSSGDYLVLPSVPTASGTYSLFVVVRIPSDTTSQGAAYMNGNGNGYNVEVRAGNREILNRTVDVLVDGSPTPGDFELWSAVRTAAPLTKFYVNGVRKSLSSDTASLATPTGSSCVGSGDGGAQFPWSDYIVAGLLYDSDISDADRGNLETYLMAKYGL